MDFQIFDPLKEYNDLEVRIHDSAESEINRLIKETGIDEEKNIQSVEEYNQLDAQSDYANKKVNNSYTKRKIASGFAIAGGVAALVGILGLVGVIDLSLFINIACLTLGVILAVSMIIVIFAKINKEIMARGSIADELQKAKDEKFDECCDEVYPLNNVLNDSMTAQLIHKVLPSVKIDRNLSSRRSAYLRECYGYEEDNEENEDVSEVLSGSINNAPFLTERMNLQTMGTKYYEGSLEVEWTEYEKDSEGNVYEVTKSQTLRAGVNKPCPEYYHITRTYFFSDAAKELSYSRKSSVNKGMSDKRIDKIVAKGEKRLDKLAKKAINNGQTFTKSTNSEFDVLYGAYDRDNEMQFRMMFTPVAQKNMVSLIKDKKYYGDDFDFYKFNSVNIICSDHAQNWTFDMAADNYYSHDIREIRNNFIEYNTSFFKNLYFELAPVMAIPLYQQTKPECEESTIVANGHSSLRQAMVMANALGEDIFKNPNSVTSSILKCSYIGTQGGTDSYRVTAHSFETQERVDYVSVLCDNGHYYDVPVYWDEYLPITKKTTMHMKELNLNSSEYDKVKMSDEFESVIKDIAREDNYIYKNGILAYIGKGSEDTDVKLSSFIKQ